MVDMQTLFEETAIRKKQWLVRTVTPLLMHGDDSRGRAETRAPSFKGVIRYWWRAVQPSSDALLARETQLFGGTGGGGQDGVVSPLRIHVQKLTGTSGYNVRPHRGGDGLTKGIPPGTSFTLEISVLNKDTHLFDDYKALIELVLAIGGFGQRSRRGFGSLQFEETEWSTTEEYLRYIRERVLRFTSQPWETWQETPDTKHPLLRNLWLGSPQLTAEEALRTIGHASSRSMASAGVGGYLLGGIRPRKASPLHATVRQIGAEFYPVIAETHLHRSPNEEYQKQRAVFLREVGVKVRV